MRVIVAVVVIPSLIFGHALLKLFSACPNIKLRMTVHVPDLLYVYKFLELYDIRAFYLRVCCISNFKDSPSVF